MTIFFLRLALFLLKLLTCFDTLQLLINIKLQVKESSATDHWTQYDFFFHA